MLNQYLSATQKTKVSSFSIYILFTNYQILFNVFWTHPTFKSLNEKAEVYFNSVVPTCTLNDLSEDVIPNVLIDDADSFINELIGLMSAYDTCVSGITLTV